MKFFIFHLLFSLPLIANELKGIATTLDGKVHIYTEVYTIELDSKGLSKKIETKYLKPDGKLFATMVSDFSINPNIPNAKLIDLRFDKTEELVLNETGDKVF